VAKVKKETGVTGERNSKSTAARGKAKGTNKGTKKGTRTRSRTPSAPRKKGTTKRGTAVKSVRATGKKTRQKRAGRRALAVVRGRPAPVVRVAVKPLDPLRKCGPNTTVQFLYRVDEQVDGRSTAHLVFFDRHGWYCEHGRSCPAVGHARKFNGQIARVS
jgi:hypothetical protein